MPLFTPGVEFLSWSLRLYLTAAPWILGIGLIAGIGRAIQLGPGRRWPKPAYMAFELIVEAVRLVVLVVIIGLGDPAAGVRSIADFISGAGRAQAFASLGSGWGRSWPEVLAATVLFAVVAAVANAVTFAIASLSPARRLAAAAGVAAAEDKRARTAVVLFIKNLTIIPFTAIWIWGVLLYVARCAPA